MKALAGGRLELTEDSDDYQTQHRTGARHDEVEEGRVVRVGGGGCRG